VLDNIITISFPATHNPSLTRSGHRDYVLRNCPPNLRHKPTRSQRPAFPMSHDDSSTADHVPSFEDTSVDDSTASVDEFYPAVEEIVDKSGEPGAEAKALELKELGNEQLLKGHYLDAIGFYSDALEYAPTNAIILSNRAQAYIKVENYGLAMSDATIAMESDPTYAKAYYRRGSAQFALSHYKDARKDFRKVCQLRPKDRDARAKFQACEKAIKEAAFLKAIESEKTAPMSASYDPNSIHLSPESYDGPHPIPDGLTSDMDLEASMFEPGNLPRAFVLVGYLLDIKLIFLLHVVDRLTFVSFFP